MEVQILRISDVFVILAVIVALTISNVAMAAEAVETGHMAIGWRCSETGRYRTVTIDQEQMDRIEALYKNGASQIKAIEAVVAPTSLQNAIAKK
ncbi:hypothetical protein BVX97_02345 [bacterium E08(2017)]|nr:hypothetical protein BVX97_02345 [bacterium E08(2017)]